MAQGQPGFLIKPIAVIIWPAMLQQRGHVRDHRPHLCLGLPRASAPKSYDPTHNWSRTERMPLGLAARAVGLDRSWQNLGPELQDSFKRITLQNGPCLR